MTTPSLKNASVVMTGTANLLLLIYSASTIVHRNASYEDYLQFYEWLRLIGCLTVPILFAWIGHLLRSCFPRPTWWVKGLVLLVIPATYLLWTFEHPLYLFYWNTGERCMALYAGVFGFLIPADRSASAGGNKGWLDLALFISASFLFVGICKVADHFAISNYQMLDSEWTKLLTRLMRFLPLAMAIWFLHGFAYSQVGQSIGCNKVTGIGAQVLAVLGFVLSVISGPGFLCLYYFYRLLSQPVSVFAGVVVFRTLCHGLKSPGLLRDIFK